jgi:DNA-binding response OmpR family regulator
MKIMVTAVLGERGPTVTAEGPHSRPCEHGRVPVRLLVVEDDDRVRAVLRMGLEDEGYAVAEAASAEQALAEFSHVDPEVMIVDLMLGGMSGFDCIREVRHTSDIPIVVVSARNDTHDVVAGLEAGADDYVTKPFQIKEITARLRALLRRTRRRPGTGPDGGTGPGSPAGPGTGTDGAVDPLASDDVVVDGTDPVHPLVLSPGAGVLRRGGIPVHLTLTEFRLLCELAEANGRVLSRAQLLERVWDHGFFGDERLVDVHVRRLRTKVEADPADPQLLVTVRGLGYRLDRR